MSKKVETLIVQNFIFHEVAAAISIILLLADWSKTTLICSPFLWQAFNIFVPLVFFSIKSLNFSGYSVKMILINACLICPNYMSLLSSQIDTLHRNADLSEILNFLGSQHHNYIFSALSVSVLLLLVTTSGFNISPT